MLTGEIKSIAKAILRFLHPYRVLVVVPFEEDEIAASKLKKVLEVVQTSLPNRVKSRGHDGYLWFVQVNIDGTVETIQVMAVKDQSFFDEIIRLEPLCGGDLMLLTSMLGFKISPSGSVNMFAKEESGFE